MITVLYKSEWRPRQEGHYSTTVGNVPVPLASFSASRCGERFGNVSHFWRAG